MAAEGAASSWATSPTTGAGLRPAGGDTQPSPPTPHTPPTPARAYAAACRRFAAEPDHVLLGLWGGNLSMAREEFLRVGVKTEMSLPRGQDDREFGIRLYRAG